MRDGKVVILYYGTKTVLFEKSSLFAYSFYHDMCVIPSLLTRQLCFFALAVAPVTSSHCALCEPQAAPPSPVPICCHLGLNVIEGHLLVPLLRLSPNLGMHVAFIVHFIRISFVIIVAFVLLLWVSNFSSWLHCEDLRNSEHYAR